MTVNLSAFAGAGAQFFDNNGDPLSGGLVYTYDAGTTTPRATYTDENGSTPNTNPIVLDSAGRTPAEIWLTTGVAYKFILRTSAGVLIGTYDDIPGINGGGGGPVSWNDIINKPTTIAGFGITDAYTKAESDARFAPINNPTFTGTVLIPDNCAVNTNHVAGYRDAPQVSKTANYQLVLCDAGKHIYMNGTSITLTIPANSSVAFPIGTIMGIVNGNSTSLSIAITTDTLTLANSTSTGTRTLAQNGMAVLLKVGATNWIINGPGLT
jgi:hypothetical protein